jgi:glycosyltransferase involved in cell wall biosynthesis
MHHPIEAQPAVGAPVAGGALPAGAHAVARAERAADTLAGLTIVLPCFNEAENVADAIRYATTAAERCARAHEIVVVDDGSSDATAAIAARFASRDRRVRLVVHSANQGYGDALRSGIAAAQMPWVLLTDADLQFDLDELEDFLPCAARADLVVGWRILRRDPVHRRVNAAAWNWLVRRAFALPVRDVDCAFKLIRRDLLERCDLRATGAMISTELLVQCLAAGGRLEQLGVHHRARVAGRQSGASPRVVARAFRELAALHRSLRAVQA